MTYFCLKASVGLVDKGFIKNNCVKIKNMDILFLKSLGKQRSI